MSTTWLDLQGWAGIKVRCRRDSGFLHFVFWLPVLLSLGVCSLCGGASHPVPVTTHTVVVRAKWNFLKLKLKKGSLLEAFQHLFGDIWWPNLWKEDWIYNFFIMTVHLTEPSWQLLFNVMLKFCHTIEKPVARQPGKQGDCVMVRKKDSHKQMPQNTTNLFMCLTIPPLCDTPWGSNSGNWQFFSETCKWSRSYMLFFCSEHI